MISAHKAVALQNAKTSKIDIRTSGGEPYVTTEDVSQARAGLATKYDLAADVAWGGVYVRSQYLAEWLLWDLSEIPKYRNQKKYKAAKLLQLCRLAVAELAHPKHLDTYDKRAAFLKCSPRTFCSRRGDYEVIWTMLNDYTNEARRHIKDRLGSDERADRAIEIMGK